MMNEIRAYQQALVDRLKAQNCVTTLVTEQAFLTVPRHLFLPGEPLDQVYDDRSIVVRRDAEGELTSSSSQPAIMAIMLEQLGLKPGQRVLEIGAGTGFNAALIASTVGPSGNVMTMDIQPDLAEYARGRLDVAGYGWVQAVAGDGGYGYPEGAPYDRIILSVASSVIAPAWREQLREGGRLVLPLILPGRQMSVAFERQGQELVSVSARDCGFMVLQGSFAPAPDRHVQIGPDPDLRLRFGGEDDLPIEVDRLVGWLSEPGNDWATRVTTTMPELGISFFPWMALQQPPGEATTGLRAELVARGDLADREVIPGLWGLGEPLKAMHTFALIEAECAAAMMLPPGQIPPLIDVNHPPQGPPTTFEVYVHQLGPEYHAAQRFVELIQNWDRAGRPESQWHIPASRWHIRALPGEVAYTPVEDEVLLDRKATKLVINFL